MNEKIFIDAENATLGRLASYAAKQALNGKEVIIVNSEKAIITGTKDSILNKYLWRKQLGGSGLKGPFISVSPEKLLKRTSRDMLPYKKERGRSAYKRIKCFIGDSFPEIKKIKSGKVVKGIKLSEICRILGWKER